MERGERASVYRRLARLIHPDKNANKHANLAFQRLSSSLRLRVSRSKVTAFGGLLFETEF